MATKTSKYLGEIGGSGTTIYKGVVSGVEYNSSLSTEYGAGGLAILERMRRSDPVVKASLKIIKLGIMQAEWYVEPAGEDAKSTEVAQFVEDALFKKMDRSWTETVQDILTYLDFGFFVGEKVFRVEEGRVWLDKLAFRHQTTISKFETADGEKGISQVLSGQALGSGGRNPSIPIGKLLIFTNEKEGDNWRGVSILRSAYKPWFFKENFEKIDAIAFEREHVGIPVFTMPINPNPKDVEKAEELGKNIRANEKAHIVLPNGWTFEIRTPAGGKQKDADDAIRRFDRQIFLNVLAAFLDLGSGPSGSRALSEDQSDAFYKSLQAIGDYVCSIWNNYGIPQLVDLNFDGVREYPKLNVTGIQKADVEAFSAAIQRFALVGAITPDDDLEAYIRDLLHLPEKQAVDVTASEGYRRAKKRKTFQEMIDSVGSEFWRPLTFAEDKVNFRSLRRQMDLLEEEIGAELPKILAPEVTNLLRDARTALEMGDAKRVEDLTVQFKDEVRRFITARIQRAYEAGKLSAANELDIPAPRTSTADVNLITTQANAMTDKITDELLNNARLNVVSQISQKTPVNEALSALEALMVDEIARTAGLTAAGIAAGGINMGRKSVFDTNPEKIYALQRSEILDSRVCPYCLSLDGRVVLPDDELANTGQFHFNCRGIWVEILVDEEEKPDVTGVPDDLRDRVGTLSEFEQLKVARPLKGSLAEEFVRRQER